MEKIYATAIFRTSTTNTEWFNQASTRDNAGKQSSKIYNSFHMTDWIQKCDIEELRIPRSLVFTIQKLLISEADVAPMRAHDGDGVLQWSNRLLN